MLYKLCSLAHDEEQAVSTAAALLSCPFACCPHPCNSHFCKDSAWGFRYSNSAAVGTAEVLWTQCYCSLSQLSQPYWSPITPYPLNFPIIYILLFLIWLHVGVVVGFFLSPYKTVSILNPHLMNTWINGGVSSSWWAVPSLDWWSCFYAKAG